MLLVTKMGQLYQLKLDRLDPEEGSKDPDVQVESDVPEGPEVQDIRHSKSSGKFLNVLKYPKAEFSTNPNLVFLCAIKTRIKCASVVARYEPNKGLVSR